MLTFDAILFRHCKGNVRDISGCLMENGYADIPESAAMLRSDRRILLIDSHVSLREIGTCRTTISLLLPSNLMHAEKCIDFE
jgi:hypothetical protein